MEFKDWITTKFLEYQTENNQRITVTEFAEYIGVAQSVLSQWMSGSRKPGRQKSIEQLVSVFGVEVYEAIGKEKPLVNYDPISEAPPAIKSRFSAAIAEANQQFRELSQSGHEVSESEAEEILTVSMSKYGFRTNETAPPKEDSSASMK